jgi:hypothetical protein
VRAPGGEGIARRGPSSGLAFRAALTAALAAATPGCGAILGIEDLSSSGGTAEGWSHRFGAEGAGRQTVMDIALAGERVLVTGSFVDAIDFGGGNLPNLGGTKLFLVSLDGQDGSHRFSKSFGDEDASPPLIARVAADGDDAIVAGSFQGTVGFGTTSVTSTAMDAFLAKIDAGGGSLWTEKFGGESDQRVNDVAASDGHVAVAGAFQLSSGFSGTSASAGLDDILLAQLDSPDGAEDYGLSFGGAGEDAGLRVGIHESGVIVGGSTSSGFSFTSTLPVGAGLFVAKLDAVGAPSWIHGFAGASARLNGLAFAPGGDIVVAGDFEGTLDVDAGASLSSGAQTDAFVVKLNGDTGALLWSKQLGGPGDQRCWDVHVGADAVLSLTGEFSDAIDLGGGPLESAGGTDVFVARLDDAGDHLWSQAFGDLGAQSGRSVTADDLGNVYLAGQLEGSIDFGHGTLNARSAEDLFIAKLFPEAP